MKTTTVYSDVRIKFETLEPILRKNGLLKDGQKVISMGPGADLIIHTSEEKQILPQTLTPEQENILNTKSIDDLGLSKARISFITNGLKVTTLRELIEYPEEEIFKFRRGTKKTIEKIREGLLKLGLGLAKTE